MSVHYQDEGCTLLLGDALEMLRTLPDGSVACIVTSPPYFRLRDYGVEGQVGIEETIGAYVERLRTIFNEARRALADDGTFWLNLGDSYSGSWGAQGVTGGLHSKVIDAGAATSKGSRTGAILSDGPPAKNLIGIPWRVAFALQDDGWVLRSDIIWSKPNGMPSSVTDRPSNKHEHVFLFSKSTRYYFDLDAIREEYSGEREISRRARSGNTNKENSSTTAWPLIEGTKQKGLTGTRVGNIAEPNKGRNPGDVWVLATQPFPEAHFACMPPALAERCVLAGSPAGGLVLDPFSGSGTTGAVAAKHGRRYIGIDLNADYLDLSLRTRLAQAAMPDGAA